MDILETKMIKIIIGKDIKVVSIKCFDQSGYIDFNADGKIYAISEDHKEYIGSHDQTPFIEKFDYDKDWIDTNHDRVNLTYIYNNIGKGIIIKDKDGDLHVFKPKKIDKKHLYESYNWIIHGKISYGNNNFYDVCLDANVFGIIGKEENCMFFDENEYKAFSILKIV